MIGNIAAPITRLFLLVLASVLLSSLHSAPRSELDIGAIKLVTINVIFCHNLSLFLLFYCFPLKKSSVWSLHGNFILLYDWGTTGINSTVCASQHKKVVIFLVTASYNLLMSSSNGGLLNYTINKRFPSFNICSKTLLRVHERRKKRNVHLSSEFNQCKLQI